MLDKGKEIQPLLDNCDKPVFLANRLFLQFCLWFLSSDQHYFSFRNREKVYQCLVEFSADLINRPVFDVSTYPALQPSSADIPMDKLRVSILADILAKCKKPSKLILDFDELGELESIFRLFDPILKAITCIRFKETEFHVTLFKALEIAIRTERCTWEELDKIIIHYTKSMNDPTVHLNVSVRMDSTKKPSYSNVKSVYIHSDTSFEINPHLTHLYLSNSSIDEIATANNLLSHLRLANVVNVKGKLPILFKSEWPHLKHLDLRSLSLRFPSCKDNFLSEKDLEFLCLTCNGPEKTLPNLTALGLTVPNDMSTNTFCDKLFALPWKNLMSLYLIGDLDLYTGFTNAVKENKMQKLTYFGFYSLFAIEFQTMIRPLSLNKLTNLRFLHLANCNLNGPLGIPKSLSELKLSSCEGLERNLLSLRDSFTQLTTLILGDSYLNSDDLGNLARAEVNGYLPNFKHLDLSQCTLYRSESEFPSELLKYFFGGSCTWNELLTLDIRNVFNESEDYKVIDYLNERVSNGYLPSLTKLGINRFLNKKVFWTHLEKLKLNECDNDSLSNIADAVPSGFLPALNTLCIKYFEGYNADIVRTLSQHGVSCHKSYFFLYDLFHDDKCICEI